MSRKAWEFRVNGIRSNGDTFGSFSDALSRMFRELNKLHFETQGAERDHNGRQESRLIGESDRLRRQVPRQDVDLKGLRNGKPWAMQINRLPWGASPSGRDRFV